MAIKYPCIHCKKPVKNNQKYILCVQCDDWLNVKCSYVDDEVVFFFQVKIGYAVVVI